MSDEASIIGILGRAPEATVYDLGKRPDVIEYWRNLSRDPQFHEVLAYCLNDLGRYAPHIAPSDIPHIQAEDNGGFKGCMFIVFKLMNGYRDAVKPATRKRDHANEYEP